MHEFLEVLKKSDIESTGNDTDKGATVENGLIFNMLSESFPHLPHPIGSVFHRLWTIVWKIENHHRIPQAGFVETDKIHTRHHHFPPI